MPIVLFSFQFSWLQDVQKAFKKPFFSSVPNHEEGTTHAQIMIIPPPCFTQTDTDSYWNAVSFFLQTNGFPFNILFWSHLSTKYLPSSPLVWPCDLYQTADSTVLFFWKQRRSPFSPVVVSLAVYRLPWDHLWPHTQVHAYFLLIDYSGATFLKSLKCLFNYTIDWRSHWLRLFMQRRVHTHSSSTVEINAVHQTN